MDLKIKDHPGVGLYLLGIAPDACRYMLKEMRKDPKVFISSQLQMEHARKPGELLLVGHTHAHQKLRTRVVYGKPGQLLTITP